MKKILVLATAAFLFTGAFANDGGKKTVKGKEACTKACGKTCCKKATDKTETKTATKAAAKKA